MVEHLFDFVEYEVPSIVANKLVLLVYDVDDCDVIQAETREKNAGCHT